MTFEEFLFTDRPRFKDRSTATYSRLTFQSYGTITARTIRVFDTITHKHSVILIYPSIEHEGYRFRIDINGNFRDKIEKMADEFCWKFLDTGDKTYIVSNKDIVEIFKKIFALRDIGFE